MDATTRFDTEIIGAWPAIACYFRRLNLASVIDEAIPWEGNVPLGTLVEILIANRLLQPKAIYKTGQWAETAGLTEYYGLTAEQLNDDLLGRALERVAAHYVPGQVALVTKVIQEFGLDIRQIHYDITSLEVWGAYDVEVMPGVPQPTYGRAKSGRKDVKQIQAGLNVTGDGGVPVGHLPLDGNASESPTHLQNLRQLAQTLGTSDFLYIGDSKTDSAQTLLTIRAGGGRFLCAGAMQVHWQDKFRQFRDRLQPVDYFPKSQAHLPAEQRDQYKAFELWDTLQGEVKGKKVRLKYRVIFVWSEAKARQEAETRTRHLDTIREEFEKVQKNLNKYKLKTREAIVDRLERAKQKYREGSLFQYTLKKRGLYRLTWTIDEQQLERWRELDGVYLLKTSMPKTQHPIDKVLKKYREQGTVERRIQYVKGPLAVTPMFLEKPERMAGLLCIVVWALMVLTLMEREVRRNLDGQPLYGLYPENRPSPAPTGKAILECFSTVCIVIIKHRGTTNRRLGELSPIQQKLLRLMGIPPGALQTFKRRCGT